MIEKLAILFGIIHTDLSKFERKIQSLFKEYEEKRDEKVFLEVEQLFEQYLSVHANDYDTWVKFSLFLLEDIHDEVKALESLKYVAIHDSNNVYALLIMGYISFMFLRMDEDFVLEKLLKFESNDVQINALVNYVLSIYFRGRNEELVKHYFEKSVYYCDSFVWNNYKLGKIYFNEGNIKKAKELTETALRNIQYIYPYPPSKEYSITPVEEFINERLKGIYITQHNLEFMQEQLEEINQKL